MKTPGGRGEGLVQRSRKIIFREHHGLTYALTDIGRLTGIPPSTLKRYRENPEIIPLGRLVVIAAAMEVSPEECGELILGEGESIDRKKNSRQP